MNLSLIKIRSVFPHFNERPITTDDFWDATKKAKVVVPSLEEYEQKIIPLSRAVNQ